MKKKTRIPLVIRRSPGNLFTLPVLLNLVERHGFTEDYELFLAQSFTEMQRALRPGRAAVVLYSFMTPHLPWVWREIKALRAEMGEKLMLIGGGAHLVGDPYSGLKMGFDAVSGGEGESTLPAMLRDALGGRPALYNRLYLSQEEVRCSSGQRTDAEVVITGTGPVNLDDSFPICHTVPMMSPLEITRGCHWHCDFCQTATVQPRHRSLDSIQAYLDELIRRQYLFRAGFICPSGFEYGADRPGRVQLHRVKEVLQRAKDAGIKHLEFGNFPSELRPNTITAEGLALINRYASNRKVTIGAQSGSNAVLKRFKRGHNREIIIRATALTREAGITPLLDFILGFPGETEEERLNTIQFARELNDRFHARTQMHFFMPLSGTVLKDEMPVFFGDDTIKRLKQAQKDGVCTDWWKEGMQLSREIVTIKKALANG